MIINQSGTCQEIRCLPDKATLLHKTQFSWNHIYRSGLFLSNICLSTHNQLNRVPSLSISHESRLDLHSLKTSAKELQIWVNVAHFNDNRPLQIGRRPVEPILQETQVSIFISLIYQNHSAMCSSRNMLACIFLKSPSPLTSPHTSPHPPSLYILDRYPTLILLWSLSSELVSVCI